MLNKHSALVDEAGDIFTMFTEKEVDADFFIDVDWPGRRDQILLGKATAIGYRSDKWSRNGKFTDYIHRHEKPEPDVIIARPPSKKDTLTKALRAQKAIGKPVGRPKAFVFAFLGYALDLEFIRDGQIMQLDWKSHKKLPIMARTVQRNLLVIQPQDGGSPVILRSPILKVTARGLEN